MSYPNFDDVSTKPLDHPDLLPLVLLAEAADIDMRIVVTQRHAYDVLYSTHLRRNYGHGSEPRVLIDNAALLYSQLLLILVSLSVSHTQSASFNGSQVSAFQRFLHPNIDNDFMRHMWSQLNPVDRSAAAAVLAALNTSTIMTATDMKHQQRKIFRQSHRQQQLSHQHEHQSRRLHGTSEVARHEELQQRNQCNALRLTFEIDRINALCPALL